MKVFALIPARGGSKGVKRKNVRNIAGKPLIAWTIENALGSELIDRVIVSTDDDEIGEVARSFGAETPFARPSELADDFASTESVMLHCADQLKKAGDLPHVFALLQCTSPLRERGELDRAIDYMLENDYDSVVSVAKTHKFLWKDPGTPTASYDYKNRPRRQELKPENSLYVETGSFYLTKTALLLDEKNRLGGKIGLFETPELQSFEIDTPLDLKICDFLLTTQYKGNIGDYTA